MKTSKLTLLFTVAVFLGLGVKESSAQWGGGWGPAWGGWGPGWGSWGPGWSWPGGSWNWQEPTNPIGRVKIEGDVNYSGKIDNLDIYMGNEPKRNPYGLIIGAGEMTKLILTCQPNAYRQPNVGEPKVRMDFYKLVSILEVRGVNLADRKGRFATFEEEIANSGRVLVWLDHTRRYLLLDSSDPTRRRVEWPWASSVLPERVFVEAVETTQPGAALIVTLELDDSNVTGIRRIFGEPAMWDRQMISVKVPGKPKPYVDRTPVWVSARGGK